MWNVTFIVEELVGHTVVLLDWFYLGAITQNCFEELVLALKFKKVEH